jgi:hypothetical protein
MSDDPRPSGPQLPYQEGGTPGYLEFGSSGTNTITADVFRVSRGWAYWSLDGETWHEEWKWFIEPPLVLRRGDVFDGRSTFGVPSDATLVRGGIIGSIFEEPTT